MDDVWMGLTALTLSRLQFAFTAFFHFLFVPLTLGLGLLLCIMETLYVRTKNEIYKHMTQFWGLLFGINFALGVATGIPLEFQFGTNWGRYSRFVGDIFGALLALEGLLAFFMEATFIGLFFFGWRRLKPKTHLICTYMMTLGTTLSALWILIANAWMNHPVGAFFNPATERMELESLTQVIFSPFAQARFLHTMAASYVLGAMFVLSISAWYMIKGRYRDIAEKSWNLAALSGCVWSLMLAISGDESGYLAHKHHPMRVVALEAMWNTSDAPAGFNVLGWPGNYESQKNTYMLKIPWVMGILLTRSLNTPIPGIKDLLTQSEHKIRKGIQAWQHFEHQKAQGIALDKNWGRRHQDVLGHGLLVKKYVKSWDQVSEEHIQLAKKDTLPHVPTLFWSFRIMVALGCYFILGFALALWGGYRRKKYGVFISKGWLRVAFYSLPLPWIAAQMGWLLAEYGRQPWTIVGWYPTCLSHSLNVSASSVAYTLMGFLGMYSILFVVDLWLLVKYIQYGPYKSLGIKEYGNDRL